MIHSFTGPSNIPYVCNTGAVALSDAAFGTGSGQIYRNNLQCTGNELRLADCPHGSVATCTHQDDAGLSCNMSKDLLKLNTGCI